VEAPLTRFLDLRRRKEAVIDLTALTDLSERPTLGASIKMSRPALVFSKLVERREFASGRRTKEPPNTSASTNE